MTLIDKLDLTNVGSVKANSEDQEPKSVKYEGFISDSKGTCLITNPSVVLKFYQMYATEGAPIDQTTVQLAVEFLNRMVFGPTFDVQSGLGFAILSAKGNMLNVVRWNKEYPTVPINTLFNHGEEDSAGSYLPMDVNVEGSFCRGERIIVNIESRFWSAYLQIRKRLLGNIRAENAFKMRYLTSHVPNGPLKE